jgi:hypothetical protein
MTTHQEGRNTARLPGHNASWTGHTTAHPSMLPALSPMTAPAQPQQLTVDLRPVSRASSGTPSLVAYQTPHHHSAAWLDTTVDTRKPSSRHQINLEIEPQFGDAYCMTT